MQEDDQARSIIQMIAAEWNAIGVSTLTRYAPPADLWGPLGYQFSDRMTGCLYTWTNANDPDDLFYWHSSQIPVSPGSSGGNLPAFFYPYSFQEEIDALTANAASTLDFAQRQDIYAEIQALLLERFRSSSSIGKRRSQPHAPTSAASGRAPGPAPVERGGLVSRRGGACG